MITGEPYLIWLLALNWGGTHREVPGYSNLSGIR